MNPENASFSQHALLLAFAAALWATACGGTFSGTGAAGAGGTGAGVGGGRAGAGTGGGVICDECPLIACNGVSTIQPGECCPTCEPSGGSGGTSSGGASSGGAAGSGCSGDFACPDIGCAPGWKPVYESGACCPTCEPDGSAGAGGGGVGGCGAFVCPGIACAQGYMLQQTAGECCPSCVPNDACAEGQQSYDMLRQMLISQPGAVACKVDKDCTLLPGNAYCGDECSQTPVNAAAAQSIEVQLNASAAKNCSTCTPIYPPCAAPFSPVCVDGQCVGSVIIAG
jgi:hypothetical protein